MEVVNWIGDNWMIIIGGVTTVFMGLKILTTLTPNTSDDKFIQGVLDVLNKITLNVGKDKNAKDS